MAKLFNARLHATSQLVQVRYPFAAAGTVLLPALATVVIIRLLAAGTQRGEDLLPLALGLWVGLTCGELARLLWWSTVTFDQRRGMVLRGPLTLARLEDLISIEHSRSLELVFRTGRDGTWRWSLPQISVVEATDLGGPLADLLGVPFRDSRQVVAAPDR